jgi:hypothetical protein
MVFSMGERHVACSSWAVAGWHELMGLLTTSLASGFLFLYDLLLFFVLLLTLLKETCVILSFCKLHVRRDNKIVFSVGYCIIIYASVKVESEF